MVTKNKKRTWPYLLVSLMVGIGLILGGVVYFYIQMNP